MIKKKKKKTAKETIAAGRCGCFGFSVWMSEHLTEPHILTRNTKAYIEHGWRDSMCSEHGETECVLVNAELNGFLHEENCCLEWPEKP